MEGHATKYLTSTPHKCQGHVDRGKTEKLSQVEGHQETRWLKAMSEPRTTKKDVSEIQLKSVSSIVPMPISWFDKGTMIMYNVNFREKDEQRVYEDSQLFYKPEIITK